MKRLVSLTFTKEISTSSTIYFQMVLDPKVLRKVVRIEHDSEVVKEVDELTI